jgi:hypothetical protein
VTAQSSLRERAELVHLRRWKAEAIEVLTMWETAFDQLPDEYKTLGHRKSECVRRYIVATRGGAA